MLHCSCSTNQLESLATTLEPIFHRDFVMTVKQRYPSACLKKNLYIAPLQTKSRGTRKKGKSKSKTSLTSRGVQSLAESLQSSALRHERNVVEGRTFSLDSSAKTRVLPQEDAAVMAVESETSLLHHLNKGEVKLEKTMSLDDFATSLANSVVEGSLSQIEKKAVDRQLSNLSDSLGNVSLPRTAETSLTGPLSGKTKVPAISQASLPRLITKMTKRQPTFTTDRSSLLLTRFIPKESRCNFT